MGGALILILSLDLHFAGTITVSTEKLGYYFWLISALLLLQMNIACNKWKLF